jgi:hypothetical protein
MEAQQPKIDPQIMAVKQALIKQVRTAYFNFINQIRNLPVDPEQQRFSFMNFDQGMMWFCEGIANAQINLAPVEPPKAPSGDDKEPCSDPQAPSSEPKAPTSDPDKVN